MKRVLIQDSNNSAIVNFVKNPSIDSQGRPAGMTVGFLRSLQKQINEIEPDVVILNWDGAGGSAKRRKQFSEYKEGRKPIRLNRNIQVLTEQEEMQNKVYQKLRLIEYLNQMPVIQFMFEETEADDLISHLVQHKKFADWQKVIVSSDLDFVQLCSFPNTIQYRPTQDEVLSTKTILEKFGIHPNNFALAKAIVGDKSDNIAGVPGLGFVTLAKRFPLFENHTQATFEDLFDYCQSRIDKFDNMKCYGVILEHRKLIAENYKLVQLASPLVSWDTVKRVDNVLTKFKPEVNLTEIRKMMLTDGFGAYNWEGLFQYCRRTVSNGRI